MTVWLVIVASGVVAFAFRFSFLALFGSIEPPGWLRRMLPFLAPAVLAALVLPAVITPSAADAAVAPRVMAAALGGVVAWRTRNVGLAVLVGLPLLWLFESLL